MWREPGARLGQVMLAAGGCHRTPWLAIASRAASDGSDLSALREEMSAMRSQLSAMRSQLSAPQPQMPPINEGPRRRGAREGAGQRRDLERPVLAKARTEAAAALILTKGASKRGLFPSVALLRSGTTLVLGARWRFCAGISSLLGACFESNCPVRFKTA